MAAAAAEGARLDLAQLKEMPIGDLASVATIKPGEIPWADVFTGAAWFHVTGITPALGPSLGTAPLGTWT